MREPTSAATTGVYPESVMGFTGSTHAEGDSTVYGRAYFGCVFEIVTYVSTRTRQVC